MRASVQTEGAVSMTSLPLQSPELYLEFCSRNDPRYQKIRDKHYVENKGVHAQQIHFLIWFKGRVVGIISGSSCVYATPTRDKFFGITRQNREKVLRGIINNVVFRIDPDKSEHNLSTKALSLWRKVSPRIWEDLYGSVVFGFETLIIEDRTHILEGGKGSTPEDCDTEIVGDFKKSPGTLYKADNWILAGVTEGNTKNHDGVGLNESYRIKKVVPKIMWCKWRDGFNQPIESFSVATWNATKKWNETLERRLKRTMPDITEEKWISLSADLKIKAKEISEKRKRYLGKSFHAIGRRIFIDGIPTI